MPCSGYNSFSQNTTCKVFVAFKLTVFQPVKSIVFRDLAEVYDGLDEGWRSTDIQYKTFEVPRTGANVMQGMKNAFYLQRHRSDPKVGGFPISVTDRDM